MAKFTFNFFVITILLAVLAVTESSAHGSYEQPKPAHTYTPPTESPPPPSNPTCRKLTELCTAYGDYSCCEGFSCTGWTEDLPGGVGVCIPSNQPPYIPTEKCQKRHQLCQPYDPYNCCEGFKCIHPRTLPPAAGIKTEDMKLPPGVGICEAIKL